MTFEAKLSYQRGRTILMSIIETMHSPIYKTDTGWSDFSEGMVNRCCKKTCEIYEK